VKINGRSAFSGFFIHQVYVGHCWIVIVKYYEMSIRRNKIVLLKNKWILSKRHISCSCCKKSSRKPNLQNSFRPTQNPDTVHCIQKPDCPTESWITGNPRNDTHTGIAETIEKKLEGGVAPWCQFWCICAAVAK
jgi:hypothetical protein